VTVTPEGTSTGAAIQTEQQLRLAPAAPVGSAIAADEQRILLQLVDLVGTYNLKRRELEKRAAALRDRLLRKRAEAVLSVHGARDAAGKPLYSNAETREAALTQAMETDAVYQQLEAERRQVQDEYDLVAVEYSVLRDRLNILLAACGVAQPVIESNYRTLFEPLS
jgi:hypothetical protein